MNFDGEGEGGGGGGGGGPVNQPPVVTGPLALTANEGAVATIGALSGASDPENAALSVINLPATLPAGVTYDPATKIFRFDAANGAYDHLAAGQAQAVTVNYAVSDGALSVAQLVTFTAMGTNDAPVVGAAPVVAASEGGVIVTLDGLAGATDADDGAVLQIVLGPAALPAGVTYDAATHSFALNPADPAYNHLALNQAQAVTVDFSVSDGVASVAQQVTFQLVGTNDTPTVASAVTAAAQEAGPAVSADALAGASDADDGASLSVVGVTASLPAGVTYDADTHRFTLDPTNAAYNHLREGQTQQVSVGYGVSDGISTRGQQVTFTVSGTNDAPVVASPLSLTRTEGALPVSLDALSGASDRDDGTTLTVVGMPATLPAGLSYSASFHRLTLDPRSAFERLGAGETQQITVSYGVSDGLATTPQTATFTIVGANDAPVMPAATVQDLVTNGGFEQGGAGWTNASGAGVETNPAYVYGVSGTPGQVMEVDVNGGTPLDAISQTVATTAGDAYVFSFDAACRGGVSPASCSFEVLWNGVVIDTITPTTTAMQHYSYTVFGAGDAGTLEFREPGESEGLGGLVDNVSLLPAIPELAGQSGAASLDSGSVTLSFTDADLSDTHAVTVGPPVATFSAGAIPAGLAATLVGALSTVVSEAAGRGTVVATLAAPDSTFDFLAAGQTLKVTYALTVSDGHGGAVTRPVSFLFVGSNDGPTLLAAGASVTGTVVELADHAAGENTALLAADGVVAFADLDLTDTHTASFTPDAAGYAGDFTLGPVDQAGDRIAWSFSVADGALDSLAAGQQRVQTYTVRVDDGHGGVLSQAVTVILTGTSDGPVAAADVAATLEDQSVTVDVLANDDVDLGATASLLSADAPLGQGTAAVVDGKLVFTPGADFDHLAAGATETVSLTYLMADDRGATAASTVLVTVTGTNDAPQVGAPLHAEAIEGSGPVGLDALAGASDVDDGATLAVVDLPAALPPGVSYDAAGHSLSLDPADAAYDHLAAGQTQQVTVAFGVSDGTATTGRTATFTVTGANDGPVAQADAGATGGNQAVTLDVLANDTDADDGATRSLVSVFGPAGKGAATLVDGQLVFTPGTDFDHLAAGATETVTLGYVMQDDQGATATASVLVTVTGANDAPVVSGVVRGTAAEDGAAVALDARANATDVDDGTTLSVVGLPAALPAGVTYDAASQVFTLAASDAAYQHLARGQSQVVTVAYGVSDGAVTTAASVSWTVTGANDAPVARPDAAVVDENASVTINVLANDTDVDDGDTRTISAVGPTALGGQVSIVDGKLVYVAGDDAFDLLTPGRSLVDSFSYTVTDAAGAASTATVSVTVAGVADGADLVGGNRAQTLVGTGLDERISGGNAEDTLSGGGGADKLYGGNGKDLLLGGSGRDQLFGQNGSDTLDGGLGDDTLSGGEGGDLFVFGPASGHDVVTDFGGPDVLKFVGAGFTSAADVLAHAASVSGGVLISLTGGATVLLQGVTLSSLSTADFLVA